MRMGIRWAAFGLWVAAATGCSALSDFDGYSYGSSIDSGANTGGRGGDSGSARADGGPDAGRSSGVDAGSDAATGGDAATDAATGGGSDAGADAGADAGVDAGPAQRPTVVVQTAGSAMLMDSTHRLHITVGAPQPMGRRADATHELTLGAESR